MITTLFIVVAGAAGVVRTLIFQDPSPPASERMFVIAFGIVFGVVVTPLAVLLIVVAHRAVLGIRTHRIPPVSEGFFQRILRKSPMHFIHIIGWASVIHAMTVLVTHYLYHGEISIVAIFVLPSGFGVLIGVWLSWIIFERNVSKQTNSVPPLPQNR